VAKLNERPLLTLTMRLQWEAFPAMAGYPVPPFKQMAARTTPPRFFAAQILACAYKRKRKHLDSPS